MMSKTIGPETKKMVMPTWKMIKLFCTAHVQVQRTRCLFLFLEIVNVVTCEGSRQSGVVGCCSETQLSDPEKSTAGLP